MMRSLYSGVTGLKTHQTKMDVIGNNIANVNTVAYKSSSITFNELMYQTTQKASGPNASTGRAGINAKQIGLGVKSGAINANIAAQGATQTTGNPFDLKINGEAFFIVNGGGPNYFTRDGSFYVDPAGNLAMQSNGYNVMGWQVDPANPNSIKQDSVSALRIMSEANMTYPPAATKAGYITGIIDKNDTNVNSESGKTVNMTFYDNLGYSYTAKISFHATAEKGEFYMQLDDVLDSTGKSIKESYGTTNLADIVTLGTTQTVKVNDARGVTSYKDDAGNTITTKYVYDEANHKGTYTTITTAPDGTEGTPVVKEVTFAESTAGAGDWSANMTSLTEAERATIFGVNNTVAAGTLDPTTGNLLITERQITGGLVKYDQDKGDFISVNGNNESIVLDFNDRIGTQTLGNFNDITIDMTTSNFYDNKGQSTVAADKGTLKGEDTGRRLGALSSITIQSDGIIYAAYDNGQTRLLGQIAVAKFANPSGLQKEGDNLYSSTMNSGQFDGIGSDVTADGISNMATGVLEMSNVDLSAEFTEMITTQRGFQANSRIITVSDTLLEELTNLKR